MDAINHILVIDDDKRIRDLISIFLQDRGFFVSVAQSSECARELLNEFVFDLIIVDVMMPDETGIEFTRKLRKTSKMPVLMLTARGDVDDRITGLESGADDYLAKPFEPKELLLRIKNIITRTKKEPKEKLFNFGNVKYNKSKDFIEKDAENIVITSNESKLLSILTDKLGEVISRDDLADLCGGINERSVDVQITRLRNKLEKDPKKPVYLKTVRGQGYILYSD